MCNKKIVRLIETLQQLRSKHNNIEWDDLTTDEQKKFESPEKFDVIDKLRSFIETDIAIIEQLIDKNNIIYRFLQSNKKQYEQLLNDIGINVKLDKLFE